MMNTSTSLATTSVTGSLVVVILYGLKAAFGVTPPTEVIVAGVTIGVAVAHGLHRFADAFWTRLATPKAPQGVLSQAILAAAAVKP